MPKYYDVSQGSTEWFQCKTGIPTSSNFSKIITPTGAFSKSKTTSEYANQLIADIMLGGCVEEHIPSSWMERGVIMEQEARTSYEFITDNIVKHGGFITDDKRRWGCSPDGLTDTNGGLEIKCPSPKVHMTYLLDNTIEKDYKPQYQGQIFVAELDYVDMFSFHPDLPPVRIRMGRDEEYLKKLEDGLHQFRDLMNVKIQKLIDAGHMTLIQPEEQKSIPMEDLIYAG